MDKETHRQLDRIEAKLDVLLELEEIEIDRNGYPIYEPEDKEQHQLDIEKETHIPSKIKQKEELE